MRLSISRVAPWRSRLPEISGLTRRNPHQPADGRPDVSDRRPHIADPAHQRRSCRNKQRQIEPADSRPRLRLCYEYRRPFGRRLRGRHKAKRTPGRERRGRGQLLLRRGFGFDQALRLHDSQGGGFERRPFDACLERRERGRIHIGAGRKRFGRLNRNMRERDANRRFRRQVRFNRTSDNRLSQKRYCGDRRARDCKIARLASTGKSEINRHLSSPEPGKREPAESDKSMTQAERQSWAGATAARPRP